MNKKVSCGDTLTCISGLPNVPDLVIYVDSQNETSITDVYGQVFGRDFLAQEYKKFVVEH